MTLDQKTRIQLFAVVPIVMAFLLSLGIMVLARELEGRWLVYLLACGFAILALVASGVLYVVGRTFSFRLAALEQGAALARSGAAEPVVLSGEDELAQISRVLGDMTREVRAYLELSRKHTELQAQLADLHRVAESLRRTNMELSDSLERLTRAQEQILRQEHVELLVPMLSGMTHDFNEGLTAILALTEFVREHPEKVAGNQQIQRWFGAIETIAQQARQKLHSLLQWTQPLESRAEPVRLRDVVEKALRATQPKWEQEAQARGARIRVVTDYRDTETLRGVLPDLVRLVSHVIVNAVEAMPQGGTLTLRTADTTDGASLQVQDTGVGMDEKILDRAFRPFFSTKEGAAGLGLTVARGIVQQHGGKIGLSSRPGGGTRVFVDLPANLPLAPPSPEANLPPLRRTLRVLLVEDDKWTMDFIAQNLKAENHDVETARNGIEGLDRYREGRFDVVITDRAMPLMNGDELARTIKRTYPYEPVVMLTGFGEIMKSKGEYPPFVDAVVSKPVTMQELTRAMAEALIKQGHSLT